MILTFVVLTLVVLAVDLITKFTISGILNPGVAWGMGAEWPWLSWLVVLFSAVIVVVAVLWLLRTRQRSWLQTIGLGLFVGGVLGNAIDRLVSQGYVHDFIDFVIFKNNIADIAIIVGAILIGVKIAFR